MTSMAKYARIFVMEPTDEYVGKRNRAAQQVGETLASLATPSRALEVASEISQAVSSKAVPEGLCNLVVPAITKQSDSFIRDGEDLQILVCAMFGALEMVSSTAETTGWTPIDALAAGLWSALSVQSPQNDALVEDLRSSLLQSSQKRVVHIAELSRKRVEVPEVGSLVIPEDAPTGGRANTAFRTATRPLVAALRGNAELDREEIDLLWWALSDVSDILQRPFSELDGAARAVATGIDCAAKLRKLPADSHRNLVLRHLARSDQHTLAEVLGSLGDLSAALTKDLEKAIAQAPDVFPLLTALRSGKAEGPIASVRLSSRDWGARALLEASIVAVGNRNI